MLDMIVNPIAGNGLALRTAADISTELTRLNISFRTFQTTHPGHATKLAAQSVKDGSKMVLAVGGDGTAYETACGLVHTSTSLGIIPAGTGNDFVKAIHMPKKPLDALHYILDHKPRPVDVGQLNDQIFLNVCGTGFDVMVLDYALKAKKFVKGIFPYLYGVIRTIFHYRPISIKLTMEDSTTIEKDVLIVSIANGQYIGGGIPIAPCAKVDDGLLDLIVVNHIPRWKIPRYLPGLLSGKVLSFPITEHILCHSIQLLSPGMRLNIDGEIRPMDQAAFAALPGALLLHW